MCRREFGTLEPAAYATLQFNQDEGIHASHGDLLGCGPIAYSGSTACLTEACDRDGPCAVGGVRRSVQTVNGIARRPPESYSCRLPGHAPHGTPREVHVTRNMDWRTLFPPVAPLYTGYPSALEKRASKHGAAFGGRREENIGFQDRSEAGSVFACVSVNCGTVQPRQEKHKQERRSGTWQRGRLFAFVHDGSSCDVGGTKSEDASSRKTGKTSAVTIDRTEV